MLLPIHLLILECLHKTLLLLELHFGRGVDLHLLALGMGRIPVIFQKAKIRLTFKGLLIKHYFNNHSHSYTPFKLPHPSPV